MPCPNCLQFPNATVSQMRNSSLLFPQRLKYVLSEFLIQLPNRAEWARKCIQESYGIYHKHGDPYCLLCGPLYPQGQENRTEEGKRQYCAPQNEKPHLWNKRLQRTVLTHWTWYDTIEVLAKHMSLSQTGTGLRAMKKTKAPDFTELKL